METNHAKRIHRKNTTRWFDLRNLDNGGAGWVVLPDLHGRECDGHALCPQGLSCWSRSIGRGKCFGTLYRDPDGNPDFRSKPTDFGSKISIDQRHRRCPGRWVFSRRTETCRLRRNRGPRQIPQTGLPLDPSWWSRITRCVPSLGQDHRGSRAADPGWTGRQADWSSADRAFRGKNGPLCRIDQHEQPGQRPDGHGSGDGFQNAEGDCGEGKTETGNCRSGCLQGLAEMGSEESGGFGQCRIGEIRDCRDDRAPAS